MTCDKRVSSRVGALYVGRLSNILKDKEASENDKFVALEVSASFPASLRVGACGGCVRRYG